MQRCCQGQSGMAEEIQQDRSKAEAKQHDSGKGAWWWQNRIVSRYSESGSAAWEQRYIIHKAQQYSFQSAHCTAMPYITYRQSTLLQVLQYTCDLKLTISSKRLEYLHMYSLHAFFDHVFTYMHSLHVFFYCLHQRRIKNTNETMHLTMIAISVVSNEWKMSIPYHHSH